MAQWGAENCLGEGEHAATLLEKSSGLPFAKLELKTIDGQIVDPGRLAMTLDRFPVARPAAADSQAGARSSASSRRAKVSPT
jgi:hypothetical protein